MKKTIALLLCLCLALCLFAGCARTEPKPAATEAPAAEPVELIVFAAASMTETMNRIAEMYKKVKLFPTGKGFRTCGRGPCRGA